MKERIFLEVDPRTLRLPPSRQEGADPDKLQRQVIRFGASTSGMPPPFVFRDPAGELVIWEGVTRATRIAKKAPGTKIKVEVVQEVKVDLRRLPTLQERLE